MSGAALIDSNVAIYAYSADHRADRADAILRQGHAISVQTLNEFVSIARRKLRFAEHEIEEALFDIITACSEVLPITLSTHIRAFALSQRYQFHIYDALIVAVALQAECETLWSEDMHDGLVVEDVLTIRNPFA